MDKLKIFYHETDEKLTTWMAKNGILLLRISLGIVFFWFGILKFFPGLSPAEGLATKTIDVLTFGLIPSNISIIILAAWETLIGLGLIFGVFSVQRCSCSSCRCWVQPRRSSFSLGMPSLKSLMHLLSKGNTSLRIWF